MTDVQVAVPVIGRDELRRLATIAARHHPSGSAAIYAEVERGIQIADSCPAGDDRKHAFEAVHAAMKERQAEADVEIARLAKVHEAMAIEQTRAIRAGGCVSKPPRDAALLEAIRVSKLRLDDAWPRLANGSEADFRAVLDDIETAMRALGSSVGVARRASNSRSRASAAAEAVAAAKAATMSAEAA